MACPSQTGRQLCFLGVLIPLALKGVKYQAVSADQLLKKNLLVYGLGGLIVPFIGIKVIDLLIGGFF